MVPSNAHRLVILYGIGGLSDVGRHAILAALERSDISSIRILTQHPEKLEESNWECGCEEPHNLKLTDDRFEVVKVDDWTKDYETKILPQFKDATAVVSCLGNRQPGVFDKSLKKGWVSHVGNNAVIKAMNAQMVERAVVITSMGIEEDWPPMEWHWGGKILGFLFRTNTKKAFEDLTMMERAYRASSDIDYLLVRPVGISEDAVPTGTWALQKEKFKDTSLGMNMAKMDVARYMVQEAVEPTRHKSAVVIGGAPTAETSKEEKE